MSDDYVGVDGEVARSLRGQLVAELAGKGVLRSPGWIEAFMAVPRHLFVPELYERLPSGWPGPLLRGDDPDQHKRWLEAVYRDDSLVTRHDGGRPPKPIVSSSAPYVMAVMLEALDVADGTSVLEIGTGTGYNAAILCRRLGSGRVTTIDLDADLVEQAALRLAALGLTPFAVAADGATGYAPRAPYDRILATCGVARIPTAWLEQSCAGKVIVANAGMLLVRLMVHEDGSAQGPFLPETASFMGMRPPAGSPQMTFHEAVTLVQADGEDVRTATPSPVADDSTVEALTELAMPGVMCFGLGKDPIPSRCLVDPATGSWARADMGPDMATVHQSGERRLWDETERLSALWLGVGAPRHDQLGLAVDPGGSHHLWAIDPGNRILLLPRA